MKSNMELWSEWKGIMSSSSMKTQWAIIDDTVQFDIGDYGMPAVWFGIQLLEWHSSVYRKTSESALQVFHDPIDWLRLCEEGNVYRPEDLGGKICLCEVSSARIHFIRMALPLEEENIKNLVF